MPNIVLVIRDDALDQGIVDKDANSLMLLIFSIKYEDWVMEQMFASKVKILSVEAGSFPPQLS